VILAPLVHFAGIALGLLLAGLLLGGSRGNVTANRWLAAYVIALVVLSAGDLLEDTRWVLAWPHAAHVGDWLIFLVGPLLWMYVRRLTMHTTPRAAHWLLHAIPAGLCLLALVPFHLLPADRKQALLAAELAQPTDGPNVVLLLAAAQMLVYWVLGMLTLRRYRDALRGYFSSLAGRTFGWLNAMLLVNLAMWLLWLVALLGRWPWADWLDTIAVPLGLYVLAFLGARQITAIPDRAAFTLPDGARPAGEIPADAAATAGRYQRSGLDARRVPELLARLESLMQSEKPWLENDLTLGDLARRAGLSSHHLSQLLNAQLNTTFFDYINRRRIAEVQRCLADASYARESILGIALASGFNSKAAFNAAFRTYTGLTPSQFRAGARASPAAGVPAEQPVRPDVQADRHGR